MRMRPTTTLAAFGLAAGFAFALPALETTEAQSGTPRPSSAMPDWVAAAKPGSGPVFLVRGKVGAGEDANAGYAWLAELEQFHLAWGGAVAGAQDVVFMIEAPDHGSLDALLASSPWSSVTFTVEPLVRTKDRLARGPRAAQPKSAAAPETARPETPVREIPSIAPARPIADPNHGDGTTHPAP